MFSVWKQKAHQVRGIAGPKESSRYLCSIYDWKFILSNIATVFSKQDHLGLPSQRLLRNIGWTLLGSRACFLLSFSSLLTKGHWKPFCEIAITTDLGEK